MPPTRQQIRRRRLALALAAILPVGGWLTSLLSPADLLRFGLPGSSAERSWPVGRGAAAAFAAGACRGYPARGRDRGQTVVVDAGHGGPDTGAVTTVAGGPVREADVSLAIAQRLRVRLQDAGFVVVLSRVGPEGVARLGPADVVGGLLTAQALKRELEARNECANAARAAALVAVHANSFSDPGVRGIQTLYNPNRPFSARSRSLAAALQDALVSGLAGWGAADRGVIVDTGAGAEALTEQAAAYGQLLQLGPAAPPWFRTPTRMPGAVVEPLFLTAPPDAARAVTAAGQSEVAAALARGVERFLAAAPAARPP